MFGSRSRLARAVGVAALLGISAPLGGPARAQTPPAATPAPPPTGEAAHPEPLLRRSDLWFFLASAGAVAIVANQDLEWMNEMHETPSSRKDDLANALQPLGAIAAVSVAAAYGYARLSHRPALEHASLRAGISIGAAVVAAEGIKLVVGRERPDTSPDDPFNFHPFSGDASFPSGHTTLAFAAARAIDCETSSRWVPIVAYPLAAGVGWSRVWQRHHWPSDVVAGAALGTWTAGKTEEYLRRREGLAGVGLWLVPLRHGAEAALATRF
jgi:hypothetical protein